MKHLILIMVCFLTAATDIQAQSAVSKPLQIDITVGNYVNGYVIPKVEAWQKQGRYESNDEYLQRVSEQTRKDMIDKLTAEAVDAYKQKALQNINWSHLSIVDYDANNQTFLIKSARFGDFTLHVPRTSAEAFERNFASVQKTAPDVYFTDNRIMLDKLTFVSAAGERYQYNSSDPRRFEKVNVIADFGAITTNIPTTAPKGSSIKDPVNITVGKADVDVNIPAGTATNSKTFAVIISNETYQQESQVEFALNDGRVFKEYCIKTLGLPEKNVHYNANATLNNIRYEINWINGVANAFNGEASIIFYYAGHGIPDETDKTAYLLPVDGYGSDVTTGYKLDDLYTGLGNLPARSVTVFLDACFSGAQRSGDMLASARGVKRKAVQGKPVGNMVVFSASQGDETAYPHREKGHGLFTYFLLKKLQDTKGEVTLGELSSYITTEVSRQSIVVNKKSQTPTVIPSSTLGEEWKERRLK
jgi:hypothetical protein